MDTVKGLLQVEEDDVHWLVFLAMLLYQEAAACMTSMVLQPATKPH